MRKLFLVAVLFAVVAPVFAGEPVKKSNLCKPEKSFEGCGSWFAGPGVGWRKPGKINVDWIDNYVDPHFELDVKSQWGLSGVIGYRAASGLGWQTTATWWNGSNGTADQKLYIRGHEASNFHVSQGDSFEVLSHMTFEW